MIVLWFNPGRTGVTTPFFWRLLVFLSLVFPTIHGQSLHGPGPWNLPVVSKTLSQHGCPILVNASENHRIPKQIWITTDKNSTRLKAINSMYTINEKRNWRTNFVTYHEQNEYMTQYFHNTSLLWAYQLINPKLGVARGDIWRYAILWHCGGVYMDDDSSMGRPFDDIITSDDDMILSTEAFPYKDDCYVESHRLSSQSKKSGNVSMRHPTHQYFFGKNLLNWAIMSKPRHKILLRTLENIVDVIKSEYFLQSPLKTWRYQDKAHKLYCLTGPLMFTASAIAVAIENEESTKLIANISNQKVQWIFDQGAKYTVYKRDFTIFGGIFKIPDPEPTNQQDPNHYKTYLYGTRE